MDLLKLMYSVNNPELIRIAEGAGVDRIWIDLEIIGKEKRQGHMDTLISRHSLEDIRVARSIISKSELIVRVNPINPNSKEEIERVIQYGADIIMLPYFRTKEEVEFFLGVVNGKVKTSLLLETPEAVTNIDQILSLEGIDEVHIGINDLHLGYNKKFLFELLSDGTVEYICGKLKEYDLPYGFGGITRLGQGALPSEYVIGEHYRLGSTRAILSRGFFDATNISDLDETRATFIQGLEEIRAFEYSLAQKDNRFFNENKQKVKDSVNGIIKCK